MAEILVGTTNQTGTQCTASYFYLGKFTAVQSKTGATEFRVYSGYAGNVKVGVYADNSGSPGARMGYNNTGQAVVAGWNTLSISACDIVNGIAYWLAIIVDTFGAAVREETGGILWYKSATYSTFTFPDPAGSDFSTSTRLIDLAVWGEAGAIEELSSTIDVLTDIQATIQKISGLVSSIDSTESMEGTLGKISALLSQIDSINDIQATLEIFGSDDLVAVIGSIGSISSQLSADLSLLGNIETRASILAIFEDLEEVLAQVTAIIKVKEISAKVAKQVIVGKIKSSFIQAEIKQ